MVMKSIKFNKDELRDKIYACWLGKNIGGTMGGPFEGSPEIKPGGQIKFKYTIRNILSESYNADVKLFIPDGWYSDYERSIYVNTSTRHTVNFSTYEITVTAGENVSPVNKLILSISSNARALEYAIPVNILG